MFHLKVKKYIGKVALKVNTEGLKRAMKVARLRT